MSKLSKEEEKLAKAAIEENDRLRRLIYESTNESHNNDENSGNKLIRADSIFSLKRKNEILKAEIADLQNQLMTFDVSASETVHEYNRLQAKRAHLRNETQGLRNIKIHQTPKVREANRILYEQMKMKKESDEHNRAAREETKRLKERREKEMDQLHILLRREAHLKEQLENTGLRSNSNDPQSLKAAIASKDKAIEKLELDIEKARETQTIQENKKNSAEELEELRKEYYSLREKI